MIRQQGKLIFMSNWGLFGIIIPCLISVSAYAQSLEALNSLPKAPKRPNIVLIMADDLGYETLSVNGSESYSTPHLDALADGGMNFTDAHALPLCTPSRVQLMTGRYNFRNYIGFGLLDPKETTFGHLLQKLGYITGVVGKWQLHGHKRQRKLAGRTGSLPEQVGFDEYLLWQVKEYDGFRYKSPSLVGNGYEQQTIARGYGPDLFVDYIEDFFVRHKDKPFFLYYPMVLTHDPFWPTPAHPTYADFKPTRKVNNPKYFADNVAYMDKLIGRLMARLDVLGLRENTLVIFLGDNGTDRNVTSQWQGQQIRGGKSLTSRWGTHVPLIVNWQGKIAPGQVNDNLVDLTDFIPTLLEAVGVKRPRDLVLDGQSFYPQLIGTSSKGRDWIFGHYEPRWGNIKKARYVHDKHWKLYGDGRIYDLQSDPDEQHPINRKTLPEKVLARLQTFQSVLDAYRK